LVHRECGRRIGLQLIFGSIFYHAFEFDSLEFSSLMQRIDQLETLVFGRRPATRLFCGAMIGILVLYYFSPTEHRFFPHCPLYVLTGLQCPGCGSLRAIHELTHGHWQTAFRFNPLLALLSPFIAFCFVRELRLEARGQHTRWNAIPPSIIWAAVVLLVSYGILRNVLSF